MPKQKCAPAVSGTGGNLRWHRMRLLRVLIGICRRIERMQASAEARRACRQVARTLVAALGNERAGRETTGR